MQKKERERLNTFPFLTLQRVKIQKPIPGSPFGKSIRRRKRKRKKKKRTSILLRHQHPCAT